MISRIATALLLAAGLQAQDITALKAGTCYLGNGRTIKNAVILIEDGRISQIGSDIDVPYNAKVLDASKHYVMPAWVLAHASSGMDRPNENMPVTPFLSVRDSVDPVNRFFENSRRYGIGTIHVVPGNTTAIGGQGMVVKPFGKTPEQMAIVERAGMKISLEPKNGSRSQKIAELTKALEDAIAYRQDFERKKKEFEEEKKNKATTKEKFEEEIDPKIQPTLDLLDGKKTAYVYVPGPTDVSTAMRLKRKFRLKCVFVLGAKCYKAASQLKQAHREGIPLILDANLEVAEKDPVTEEETIICPAKVLYDAGIPFALTSRSGGGGRARFMRRGRSIVFSSAAAMHPATAMPWWQVATCVRNGMSERAAIEAFTSIPAKILGLSKQLGSIDEGKDATFQVLTSAPMEPECQVDYLVCEGRIVYDRSKDPRVKELTGVPAKPEGSR